MTQSTALYRHRDGKGRLLYVGISLHLMARLSQHRHGSKWFDRIRRIDVEWFDTREAAHAAERAAIRAENPKYKERYPEAVVVAPQRDAASITLALGTYQLSEREQDRLIDMVCRPPYEFDTINGLAANFETNVAYLSRLVVIPDGVTPTWDDLIAIADRVSRGLLVIEAPWICGSPLPSRCTETPAKPKRARAARADRVPA